MRDADASRPQPGLRRAPVRELPRLHQIVLPTPWDVGPVQIYVIEDDPLTLVDTGVRTAPSHGALEAAFAELGRSLAELRRIVLTHYHGDHLGQAHSLRQIAPDLEVWVHQDDATTCELFSAERDENIEDTEALFREHGVPEDLLARQRARLLRSVQEDPLCDATPVERRLVQGDRIPFETFRFEVLHAPGHTAGHVLLHEEPSGTVLTGDHVMGDAVPYTENYYLDGSPDPSDPVGRRPRFRGLPRYVRSLRQLRGGAFRTILPAHGGVIDRPAQAIDEALLFYEVRIQRIERALRRIARQRGRATPWEIWQRLFPRTDPVTQMRTRMFMVIGGLDLLEEDGRLEVKRRDDGVLVYRPA